MWNKQTGMRPEDAEQWDQRDQHVGAVVPVVLIYLGVDWPWRVRSLRMRRTDPTVNTCPLKSRIRSNEIGLS